MKISIILGTRPEIIKLSPVIRYCAKNDIDYFIIHTNQHYSKEMDQIFFDELSLPAPKYNLGVGSGQHGRQTGLMLERIEDVLLQECPDFVFVQGDTNTVLAGALAAAKLNIRVAHVEAGLRSYDRKMPEEINRILVDSISDVLLCPSVRQQNILLKEGIPSSKVFVVGNTVVDAVLENLELSKEKSKILEKFALKKNGFILLTMHRPSNVDSEEALKGIFDGVYKIYLNYNIPILFPTHPRTAHNIEKFNIHIPEYIKSIAPLGYLDMLQLISNAQIILTDSGGIQEEACILKTPTLTLRNNTERPETVEVGASVLVGNNKDMIIDGYIKMLASEKNWENPFGANVTEKLFKHIVA